MRGPAPAPRGLATWVPATVVCAAALLYDAIVAGGGRFYLSAASSRARGVMEADLAGKPAEFSGPDVLVRLAMEAARMFSY
ncbi:MAG TPA: hypothetical protein VMN60_06305 [Longimicrobiales bacterium]|nr:hypothetical protein [Longimicrobiales bacterium]